MDEKDNKKLENNICFYCQKKNSDPTYSVPVGLLTKDEAQEISQKIAKANNEVAKVNIRKGYHNKCQWIKVPRCKTCHNVHGSGIILGYITFWIATFFMLFRVWNDPEATWYGKLILSGAVGGMGFVFIWGISNLLIGLISPFFGIKSPNDLKRLYKFEPIATLANNGYVIEDSSFILNDFHLKKSK